MAALRRINPRTFLGRLSIVSALCVVVGVAWLLMLPLDAYSRRTYISENALLPGQVHTYFSGSERHIFQAYRNEVAALGESSSFERVEKLASILRQAGLKVGKQKYSYQVAGEEVSGENIYAVLQAPRGDATEALVMCAGWRNAEGELNEGGVALVMTLARYLKGWSVWSKDIIFLISEDSRAGPQAWVDAYHDMHDPSTISSLPIKSGAIQGVVVVDYPDPRRFESIHIIYDGVNGQLPNLDLINTASQIAIGQMGIRTTLQEMWQHTDSYQDRLRTMLRGMMNQGLGHASGAHSPFIPYHIDAITLQAYGDGWHDELALGRVLESLFRSLNNLLEHFHQSFFFYLLMAPKRFVSIGTYLPSAMLIAVNFTIVAIGLWAERQSGDSPSSTATPDKTADGKAAISSAPSSVPRLTSLTKASTTAPLLLPVSFVLICHALGFIPLYIFNNLDSTHFTTAFFLLSQINLILPVGIACLLCGFLPKSNSTNLTNSTLSPTHRLTSCFSLLLLGMFLSALATLNFSLSLLIGLISTPLSFSRPYPNNKFLAVSLFVLLQLMSPTTALWAIGRYWELPVTEILAEAAFGWRVWGMWTQVVVWCVWYPAWVVGAVGVAGSWVN